MKAIFEKETVAERLIKILIENQAKIQLINAANYEIERDLMGLNILYKGKPAIVTYINVNSLMATLEVKEKRGKVSLLEVHIEQLLELMVQ